MQLLVVTIRAKEIICLRFLEDASKNHKTTKLATSIVNIQTEI